MDIPFKKILLTVIYNFSLFFILIVGIQNSSNQRKVNFLMNESIQIPVSFIIGMSFISGSIVGSLLPLELKKRVDK